MDDVIRSDTVLAVLMGASEWPKGGLNRTIFQSD